MIRRKPRKDPVTPEVRAAVFERDRYCFARRVDNRHECRNTYGQIHNAWDRTWLTLDHVHDHAMMGRRAPSDAAHLVAMCFEANVNGWASAHRTEERSYLAAVGQAEHGHVEPVYGCDECLQVFG